MFEWERTPRKLQKHSSVFSTLMQPRDVFIVNFRISIPDGTDRDGDSGGNGDETFPVEFARGEASKNPVGLQRCIHDNHNSTCVLDFQNESDIHSFLHLRHTRMPNGAISL